IKSLPNTLNNLNHIKPSTNYINQHNQSKQPYNQPLTNPHTLINPSTNPLITLNTVNQKPQPVTTPQNNLHPQQKLQ
ncbi:hypothetical protein, partial [Staphylococcus capitis]|uniref:hypothetical protein n=1 Tax=Staphylococcus capitis TaxID=29388 RepID=UPI001C92D368